MIFIGIGCIDYVYEIRYFKRLYLIHVCPLRGRTAATGRQSERTAYPRTAPGNEKRDLYASTCSPC